MLCRFCKRQIADSTRICPYCLSDLLLGTPSDSSVSNSDVAPQQNEHTSETSLQKQQDDLYKNSAQTWESKHFAAANKEEIDSAVHQTNGTPFTANASRETTVTAASLQASLDASLQHFLYEQDTAPNKSSILRQPNRIQSYSTSTAKTTGYGTCSKFILTRGTPTTA